MNATTTNLLEISGKLNHLSDDLCIFGAHPWSAKSEYLVAPLIEGGIIPEEIISQGFKYFLEISVAREICKVLGKRSADRLKVADLLLFYAENDAFPSWVYNEHD